MTRLPLLGAAALLVACQTGPVAPGSPSLGTPPTPTPAPGGAATTVPTASPGGTPATASPAASPSAAGTATPTPATPTPVVKRATVVGAVFNEQGTQIEDAQVRVESSDPAFNRMLNAAGGAFGLRDVPVGTTLTFIASAPDHTVRSRTIVVSEERPLVDDEVNRVEFGGLGAGMFHYLTRWPEIARTEPAAQSKRVKSDPLEIVFHFSHAIREDDRPDFARLIRVRVPSAAGEQILQVGTLYRNTRAEMVWDDDGKRAVFRFKAPVVTRLTNAAIVVDMDPDIPLADWPEDLAGRRLGYDVAPLTADGAGGAVRDKQAAFARHEFTEPRPTALPSPLNLWGLTHFTTLRFELAGDTSPLQVLSADFLKGLPGEEDIVAIKFNKPMRGFPEDAVSSDTRSTATYRFVLGKTGTAQERASFAAADPSKSGDGPIGVTFDPHDPNVVILRESASTFGNYTRFKLYVDPRVEDVAGTKLADPKGVVLEGDI